MGFLYRYLPLFLLTIFPTTTNGFSVVRKSTDEIYVSKEICETRILNTKWDKRKGVCKCDGKPSTFVYMHQQMKCVTRFGDDCGEPLRFKEPNYDNEEENKMYESMTKARGLDICNGVQNSWYFSQGMKHSVHVEVKKPPGDRLKLLIRNITEEMGSFDGRLLKLDMGEYGCLQNPCIIAKLPGTEIFDDDILDTPTTTLPLNTTKIPSPTGKPVVTTNKIPDTFPPINTTTLLTPNSTSPTTSLVNTTRITANKGESSDKTTVIIALVVILVLVIIITVVVCVLVKRRRTKPPPILTTTAPSPESTYTGLNLKDVPQNNYARLNEPSEDHVYYTPDVSGARVNNTPAILRPGPQYEAPGSRKPQSPIYAPSGDNQASYGPQYFETEPDYNSGGPVYEETEPEYAETY